MSVQLILLITSDPLSNSLRMKENNALMSTRLSELKDGRLTYGFRLIGWKPSYYGEKMYYES